MISVWLFSQFRKVLKVQKVEKVMFGKTLPLLWLALAWPWPSCAKLWYLTYDNLPSENKRKREKEKRKKGRKRIRKKERERIWVKQPHASHDLS